MFEDDEIKGLLEFVPWWAKLSPSAEQQGDAGESSDYNHHSKAAFVMYSKSMQTCIFDLVQHPRLRNMYRSLLTRSSVNAAFICCDLCLRGTDIVLQLYTNPQRTDECFLCPPLEEGQLVSVSLPESLRALQQKDTCHYERLNLALP